MRRAHGGDTFAAVVVEHNGLLAFIHKLLVEHIEHLQERAAGRHILDTIFDELTGLFGTTLTPNLQIYVYCSFHYCSKC